MRRIFTKASILSYAFLCMMLASVDLVSAYPTGQLANINYVNQRMWGAWVGSDTNNDGWREIYVCGAIFTRCNDINPAHLGPIGIWDQQKLHHEVCWGCNSGIDANGDGVTEVLTFETVQNNHYLLDGKTGDPLESDGEDNRRAGLYWPGTLCGTGLNGTDVNGNGIADYVITGIDGGNGPVLRCVEGKNGSTIWSVSQSFTPNGVQLVTANNSLRIMTSAGYVQLYYPNGTGCGSISTGSTTIIPNGAGFGHDAVVRSDKAYNVSNGQLLFTSPVILDPTFCCGDVNKDGVGDYGGVYPDGKKVAVVSGTTGVLIRNHTAQDLENYMHGVIGVGDLDRDGYTDYAIFGDFALCEVFSGQTGTVFLQIKTSHGVEELYPIPDVNGNGYTDIMTFNGGATVIDGSTRGLVVVEFTNVEPFMALGLTIFAIFLGVIAGLSVILFIVVHKYRKLTRK